MTWKDWITEKQFWVGDINITSQMIEHGFVITFPVDENGNPNKAWPNKREVLPSDMSNEYDANMFSHSMGYKPSIHLRGLDGNTLYRVLFFDDSTIGFQAASYNDALKHCQDNNWDYKLLTKV